MSDNLARWCNASTLLGSLVWIALFAAALDPIQRVLSLALLVVTPLLLPLVDTPSAFYRGAMVIQPLCAALALAAFFAPQGIGGAVLTIPWLMLSGLVALYGLSRLRQGGLRRIDEHCIDAAMLYLPVGAVWLLLSRLGGMPLGFAEPTVTLTAVHFHYAGFATPILAAMTGRKLLEVRPAAWPLYRVAAFGVIGGPPLLAIGITFSPLVEVIAALWLSISLALLGLLVLFVIAPRAASRLAQTLLTVSCGASLAAMCFAAVYAVGEFSGSALIDIPQMARLHGLANALGFVLCGALAWRLLQRKSLP